MASTSPTRAPVRLPGAARPASWRALLTSAALLLVSAPATTWAGEHVRVVLDISKSMNTTDPSRLATLSTVLLYDLANPNLSRDDSFVVLPFHPTDRWQNPTAPPPARVGIPIVPRHGDREGFVQEIRQLQYNGDWTHYYPGLQRSIQDLSGTPGGLRDIRVMVLVTDGQLEAPTDVEEIRRIREELVPEMERQGIRFYVLAFGPKADRTYFDPLVTASSGASVGEAFVDPQGDRLLHNMAEIFSRSFGYTQAPPRTLPGIRSIDLAGGVTPERVAVAVFSPHGTPAPGLILQPPPGGTLNRPGGLLRAEEVGAAYTLSWVLSPDDGDYRFDTDAQDGSVAVLRPTRLELEVRPAPPDTLQTSRVMAETPTPWALLVQPSAGGQGDVAPAELSFKACGGRSGREYGWCTQPGAPPAGSGKLTPDGRIYPIQIELPADRSETPRPFYVGYLEMEARRREAVVGALRGSSAHRVDVYPLLRIHPQPSQGDARPSGSSGGQPTLARRQEGCTTFLLSLEAGHLPHPSQPRYPLRATIDSKITLDGPLHEASFILDGRPVQIERHPGPEPGEWFNGRTLDKSELLGEHRLCLHLGKPTAGDPGTPLEIPLNLTLMDSPYDEYRVVQPFLLKARIAPPTFLERWQPLVLAGAGIVLLGLLLWYLRDRPMLPADLCAAVTREGSGRSAVPTGLGEASLRDRLLGLRARRPVETPGERRRLGWIVPVDEHLYRFRPGRGVRLEPNGEGPAPAVDRGEHAIAVHRTYWVAAGDTRYALRLQFDPGALETQPDSVSEESS